MGSIVAALGVRSGDKERASSFVYNAEGGSRSRIAISRTDTEHEVTAISMMAVVTMETCDSIEESRVT